MEQEINSKIVLESDWLKARMKKAEQLKRRRENYKNSKAKILARNKAYRATHKDTRDRSKYRKEYYMKNRDKLLLQQRNYRLDLMYVEKRKAYMKEYHKKHGW